MPAFTDRTDAGRRLVAPVAAMLPAGRRVTVVGLPRGGVVVGAAVVDGLRAAGWAARLDLLVVTKVLAPEHPELALGAVTERVTVRSAAAGGLLGVDDERFAELVAEARHRLAARVAALPTPTGHSGGPADASAVLVDDGLATGSTVAAAVADLRASGGRWTGLAVPVADAAAWERAARQVDAAVTLVQRRPLRAVSLDYRSFPQLADDVVLAALTQYR